MTEREYTAGQIIDIGGQDWQGRRVYLNNWPALAGIETSHYRSGGLSHATIDGAPISNTKAGKILNARVYLDVASGRLVVSRSASDEVRSWDDNAIHDAVAAAVDGTTCEAVADEAQQPGGTP